MTITRARFDTRSSAVSLASAPVPSEYKSRRVRVPKIDTEHMDIGIALSCDLPDVSLLKMAILRDFELCKRRECLPGAAVRLPVVVVVMAICR